MRQKNSYAFAPRTEDIAGNTENLPLYIQTIPSGLFRMCPVPSDYMREISTKEKKTGKRLLVAYFAFCKLFCVKLSLESPIPN